MVQYTTSELEEIAHIINNMNPTARYIIIRFHILLSIIVFFYFIHIIYSLILITYKNDHTFSNYFNYSSLL